MQGMLEVHSTMGRQKKTVQSKGFDDQCVTLPCARPDRLYLERHSDLAPLKRTLIPYL